MKHTTPLLVVCLISRICFSQSPDTRGAGVKSVQNSSTGKTYAIVIGISRYKEVSPLRFADRDAAIFADYLLSKKGMALDSSDVNVFLNDKANIMNIGSAISDIMQKKVGKGDRIIFFFAGHGDYDANIFKDQALLLLHGSPKQNYFQNVFAGDFISTADLNARFIDPLAAKGCQVMLIVDACHASGMNKQLSGGAEGGKITSLALQSMTSPVKIYSCQEDELSLESEQWGGGRGLFSYVLMEGLYGMADANNDKDVTFRELQRYLEDHVPLLAAPNKQGPIVKIDNPAGSFAKVDEAFLASYKKQKDGKLNFLAKAETKGNIEEELKKMDRAHQVIYKEINVLVDSGKLDEAYTRYQKFKLKDSSSDVSVQLLRNLSASLQEKTAKILAPLSEDVSKLRADAKTVANARADLEKAADLLGDAHYLNKNLRARILFLRALESSFRLSVISSANKPSALDTLAIGWLLSSMELEPQSAYTYYYLGKFYSVTEDYGKAAEYYEKYKSMAPKSHYSYANIGIAYYRLKKYDSALLNYYTGLSYAPTNVDSAKLYTNLGNVYSVLKDYTKAKQNHLRAIELNPVSLYYANLVKTELLLKEYDAAIKHAIKAVELDIKNPIAHYNLCCVYALTGDNANALRYLESALKTGYSNLKLLAVDTDINSIRTLPDFKLLMEKHFTPVELEKYPLLYIVQVK
ncbi:MAG TPA: caspase family protein [Flavitalea sp.]|nr:caspase family protein [Flavitalea sp.]